jgi:polyhydroxybutyrate depolymerase
VPSRTEGAVAGHRVSMLAGRAGVAAVLAALALAGVAACGPRTPAADPGGESAATTALPVGQSTQTITIDGTLRTYRVYRPAGLPSPAALVVMLHGGFGTGSQAERSYGWDQQADRAHFLVAYPDGLNRAWNAGGGCCGKPAADGVNDVAFITGMVAAIGHRLRLDPRRLYVTGISNGGIMAYRLACDTSVFAAIGPDSATQLGSCPHPAPVSVLHIHGTADHNIPYDGGRGDGVAHIDGPPVPSVIAAWRQTDGCTAPVVTVRPPVTTSVATCPDGRAVELITIQGAGHQWPGAPDRPLIQRILGTDPPSTALSATAVLWQFFARHPKPAGG